MFLRKWSWQRYEPRIQSLEIEVKGQLSHAVGAQHYQVPFLLWDVSNGGLGIITGDRLTPGEILQVTFGRPFDLSCSCSVVWCELQENEYDFQEPSFRCGLILVRQGGYLQTIIAQIEALRREKA